MRVIIPTLCLVLLAVVISFPQATGVANMVDWIFGIRNKPVFDVREYGASPTVADNAVAIQAAITACDAAGGGEVLVPSGIFDFTGPLTVSGYTTLKGVGQEATVLNNISAAGDGVVFSLAALAGRLTRQCGIRDLSIAAGGGQQYRQCR